MTLFFEVAGAVLAVLGLALGYWQWRASGSQVVCELALVRPDGLPYFPKPGVRPRWQVTARNRGRLGTNVVEVELWMTDNKPVRSKDIADGPALPVDLQPGHKTEWIYPPNLTYNRGRPIAEETPSWLGPKNVALLRLDENRLSFIGRVVTAKIIFGTGTMAFAHKTLREPRDPQGTFQELRVTRRDAKARTKQLQLIEEGRRLGLTQ
jgi:hypothetical protein